MSKLHVRLAFWRNGAKPGDVVEMDHDEYKVAVRDGHVAEVVEPSAPKPAKPPVPAPPPVKPNDVEVKKDDDAS